jgi:glutamate formiminotransferase
MLNYTQGVDMAQIVEFIPNFSEGRRQEVIDELVACAKSVPGVTLLDMEADVNHNRSVFTLLGDPAGMEDVALKLAKVAAGRIDLNHHKGEHPRMGAADVYPFVPIKDMTMDDAVALSKKVAERMWKELQIPSFLYEASASRPERQSLAECRKGQFEGMNEKLKLPDWAPDYGERQVHPTAGITAVGARPFLIAYNINLDTSDIEIANKIAKMIRGLSGGYKYIRALGVMLEDRKIAQVSINFVNFEKNPIYRIQEAVRTEAKRWGVNIIGSELIGLAPAKALIDAAEYYLQIENFDYKKQILENHLL